MEEMAGRIALSGDSYTTITSNLMELAGVSTSVTLATGLHGEAAGSAGANYIRGENLALGKDEQETADKEYRKLQGIWAEDKEGFLGKAGEDPREVLAHKAYNMPYGSLTAPERSAVHRSAKAHGFKIDISSGLAHGTNAQVSKGSINAGT